MRRCHRGAVAVEFALVFSFIVLPIILGIVQYGYHYWALSTADAVAREAVRNLSVGVDETCTRTWAVGELSGPAVGSSGPTMTTGGEPGAIGKLVTVRVQFDSLDLRMPFLPLPDGGRIDRTAEARVEYAPPSPQPCP